jgi:phospho-N-acetylmuramoyl-pentapeptide-transferase
MFLKLLYPLVHHFSFFNIFQYITFRAAYAAITALLLAFLFGPLVIAKLRALKAGRVREDTPASHQAKVGTPSMGGVLIVASVVVSVLLWQDVTSTYTWLLLLALLGFGAIGFADDLMKILRKRRGISAGVKFGGQFLVSAVVAVVLFLERTDTTTLLYIPFLKHAVIDLSWLYIPFAMLFMVWNSNAVNLTDGLDGLATGLVIMLGLSLTVIAYLTGRVDYAGYLQIPFVKGGGEIAVFSLALVGASTGFLWFNAHPADIWMGDTGSLALGGVLGVIALMLKKEILLLVLGGVFLLEGFSVVIQVASFKLTGKRVFRKAPLHHHFEEGGWAESKVVARLWILGGLFAILGLSTLKIQ